MLDNPPPPATSESQFVNPATSWPDYREHYARHGRVQVLDFLAAPAAQWVSDIARGALPWILEYRDGGQSRRIPEQDLLAMSEEDRRSFQQRLDAVAREDFQFAYFSCSLSPDNVRRFPAGHPIHRLAERIVNRQFLSVLRELVGDPAVRGLTASFTRYDPGQFLLPHDDTDTRDDRRAAYVLNLSEDWWPDWGGLLQFIDDRRNVVETFSPHHDSLTVFKVPQMHAVSYVTPHAPRSRYAITGWLIA